MQYSLLFLLCLASIALNASAIATLKDISDLNKSEYSTTFGANINFNAK